jgi:hypothetical protein
MTTIEIATGTELLARFRRTASSFSRPRQVDLDMLLQFGLTTVIVHVRGGCIADITESAVPLQSSDFSIRGSERGWINFWKKIPEPGWHDILSLNKSQEFSIEGNLQPLMANLQFIKDLLASPRGSFA